MVCCHAIASSMRKKVAVEKLRGIEDLHLEAVLAAVAQFEPVELTTRRRITLESNSPGCGCRGAGCSAICRKARWCCARVSSLSTLARLVHPRGFRGGSVVFHAGQVRQDQGNPRAATADRGAPRRPTVRPGTVRTSSAHSPPASTKCARHGQGRQTDHTEATVPCLMQRVLAKSGLSRAQCSWCWATAFCRG